MNDDSTVAYRLGELSRRLDRVESLEPAVMKRDIREIADDIRHIAGQLEGLNVKAMAKDLVWVKRAMFGFVTTFAISSITMAAILLTSRP